MYPSEFQYHEILKVTQISFDTSPTLTYLSFFQGTSIFILQKVGRKYFGAKINSTNINLTLKTSLS